MAPTQRCNYVNLGSTGYLEAWELQKQLAGEVANGNINDTLLLLEHPHTFTLGRRGKREDVLLTDNKISTIGAALHEVDRGGEATYHGPGQIIAYPIINLTKWGGPIKYVRCLEKIIIDTLFLFNILSGQIEGLTGVWANGNKIASIGVKISRGVASHGFSLNVNTDLSYFDHIVPCGITNRGTTSMHHSIQETVDMDSVRYSIVYHFGKETGLKMEQHSGISTIFE